jgi:alpha-glucosidase
MLIDQTEGGFDLRLGDRVILRHRRESPFAFVGHGEADIAMNRGHFRIDDYVDARIPLTDVRIEALPQGVRVRLAPDEGRPPVLALEFQGQAAHATVTLTSLSPGLNRLWMRLEARAEERVWGGGEQMSYFDLRGRRFPLWTSEPGVGRDKSTPVTFKADQTGAGGDYFTTNYPQPTFLSSRRYALHVETTAYCAFDFRHSDFHEIEVWAIPRQIELWSGDTYSTLVSALSDRFGRPPPLPDWVLRGAIVGLKAGDESFRRLEAYKAAGAALSGLWCEDWVGVRETSFGRRLFWDWKWSPERYPDLDARIRALEAQDLKFLGYINPYLCVDGSLYPVAKAAGFLALKPDADEPYLVDFGEFDCGIVDFTNPAARAWFEDEVIGRNLLDFGLAGWMADFGEYLPQDVRLASGQDGMLAHNAWPTLWAEVNAKAVAARGKTGETLFFMRAGYTGVQAHCPLLWAGDQLVDFSRHDGLQTVICAALSSGLLGNAYHHSDIGGYTSLFGVTRTAELIQRWSEMAAFTAVMRSHEGNRPDANLQIDQDPATLAHFARMTRVYRRLAPYIRALSVEASQSGLPLQRPLFLHFENDPRAYDAQTVYLFGPDLLVAPVTAPGATTWRVYLPLGARWVHLWSHAGHDGGTCVEVAAPLGEPPVFYREGSTWAPLFDGLAEV